MQSVTFGPGHGCNSCQGRGCGSCRGDWTHGHGHDRGHGRCFPGCRCPRCILLVDANTIARPVAIVCTGQFGCRCTKCVILFAQLCFPTCRCEKCLVILRRPCFVGCKCARCVLLVPQIMDCCMLRHGPVPVAIPGLDDAKDLARECNCGCACEQDQGGSCSSQSCHKIKSCERPCGPAGACGPCGSFNKDCNPCGPCAPCGPCGPCGPCRQDFINLDVCKCGSNCKCSTDNHCGCKQNKSSCGQCSCNPCRCKTSSCGPCGPCQPAKDCDKCRHRNKRCLTNIDRSIMFSCDPPLFPTNLVPTAGGITTLNINTNLADYWANYPLYWKTITGECYLPNRLVNQGYYCLNRQLPRKYVNTVNTVFGFPPNC